MRRPRRAVVLGVVLVGAAFLGHGEALAEKRVALVIGNSVYEHAPALANPVSDARGMAAALNQLGFEVVAGFDLSRGAMEDEVREFAGKLATADVGLFYYAGHGLQVAGTNYLVPVDAKLDTELDLKFGVLELSDVLEVMEAQVPTSLVFLDACRDNPLAQNLVRSLGATRSTEIGRGLARVDAGVGTFIAYATAPGQVALDGEAANSPFTAALLAHILTPGLEVRQLMSRVRNQVLDETRNTQVPWDHSSLTGDFYFDPTAAQAGTEPAAQPEPRLPRTTPTSDDGAFELAFWESIENTGDPRLFEAYLTKYPEGAFAAIASLKIEIMNEAEVADLTRSGRGEALARLNEQVVELADLLSLETQANIELRGNIDQLAGQLQASTVDREDLARRVSFLLGRQEDLLHELEAAGADDQETTVDDLELAAAIAMLEAAQATEQELRDAAAAARGDLSEERRLSSAAQRQVALLNQQIAQIRIQLATLQTALDASETTVEEQKIGLANLGTRLNVALASKVEELSRYRSEFFGRLREILAGRSDVSIQGDRFVIQSGVLFDSGSAVLGPEGRQQLADLAALLIEITTEIPTDLNWILRIDGHTDKRPIRTAAFRSNWELSAARAITVAQHLIDAGVPPERLAATGFGEFQPVDEGESEVAYRNNRRIELKLTER